MDTLFNWCAVVGGIVFLGQFALSLLGGADTEIDTPDIDVDVPDIDVGDGADTGVGDVAVSEVWFVGMFSLRAILSGITVFGMAGLGTANEFAPFERMALSLAAGFGTMYAMGWLVRKMHGLEHDGTVRLQDTLRTTGIVYLTIPGHNAGVGKVTLNVKGRTMEYPAVTETAELPTGTPVVVAGVLPPETVKVTAVAVPTS